MASSTDMGCNFRSDSSRTFQKRNNEDREGFWGGTLSFDGWWLTCWVRSQESWNLWNECCDIQPQGEKMKFEGEKPSINFKYKSKAWFSSWWFQPVWKNTSQIGSFPQVGVKKKIFELPPPSSAWEIFGASWMLLVTWRFMLVKTVKGGFRDGFLVKHHPWLLPQSKKALRFAGCKMCFRNHRFAESQTWGTQNPFWSFCSKLIQKNN